MHIIHISSVHSAADPRIRFKQLAAVTANGWRGTLITGDMTARKTGDGVRIIRVRPGNSVRWKRMLITSPAAVLRAFAENADIYHIHDLELLPWARLLRIKGKPVVYDIHEDYETSLGEKPYFPRSIRPVAAAFFGAIERFIASGMNKIIAEKHYSRRFPDAVPILNRPPLSLINCGRAFEPGSGKLLYTGNLTEARGALNMARLVRFRPDFQLTAVGRCRKRTAEAIRREAGPAAGRILLQGLGRHVPFDEIIGVYRNGGWLAGLALFSDTKHCREKELTKFFEYMAVGLPVVASDFPAWKRLIQDRGAGLCVDPEDPAAVAAALDRLRRHPDEALAMGMRGKELVRTCFNWEIEAGKLIAFYDALSRRGSRPGLRGTRPNV